MAVTRGRCEENLVRRAGAGREAQGVDAIGSLTDLIEAGRNVQAAARFIDFHDRMMELAVTRIGVSA